MRVAEQTQSMAPVHWPDDRDLLRRMARGEEPALEMLAVRYHRRLFTYLFRVIGDRSRAEELLQDVLLAAWRNAPRFRGEARVSTWLMGIAHHKAVDALRRPPPEASSLEEGGAVADLPSADPEPQEVVEGRDEAARLAAALKRLSGVHRATLELVLARGLSLQEVAEITGVPVGTVKSRLHYARRRLRQELHGRGGQADATR